MISNSRNAVLLGWWIGLVLVGSLAVVWPRVQSYVRLTEEHAQLSIRVQMADDGAAAIERLERTLEKTRRRAQEKTKPIPDDPAVAGMIQDLSAQLDAMQMNEREITTGRPERLEKASLVPMSIVVHGEFPSVYEMIDWVESLPRLVRIARVHISTKRDRNVTDERFVRAELLLDLFYAPLGGNGDIEETIAHVPTEGER